MTTTSLENREKSAREVAVPPSSGDPEALFREARRRRRRRRSAVVLVISLVLGLAVVGVVLAGSGSNGRSQGGVGQAPMPSHPSPTQRDETTTTGAVSAGQTRQLEIQTCVADFESLRAALDIYRAHVGEFPPLAEPWSPSVYEANFGALLAHQNGGPFMNTALDPSHYVIEYDQSGNEWVEPPGTFKQTVDGSNVNFRSCSSAVR
jgi:hypothetical protein